jgi:hypothetical protein
VAGVFAYNGGGGDGEGWFVPGDEGNCGALAMAAVVFSYDGSGGDTVGYFVAGDGDKKFKLWRCQ